MTIPHQFGPEFAPESVEQQAPIELPEVTPDQAVTTILWCLGEHIETIEKDFGPASFYEANRTFHRVADAVTAQAFLDEVRVTSLELETRIYDAPRRGYEDIRHVERMRRDFRKVAAEEQKARVPELSSQQLRMATYVLRVAAYSGSPEAQAVLASPYPKAWQQQDSSHEQLAS